MNKRYSIVVSVVFCLFLGGMFLWHLITPDLDFSPVENRYLEGMPEFSLEALNEGDFTSKFEKYTTDQFPARDFWVATKAWSERLTGKQENKGVYFGAGDTLINRVDAPDQADLDKKLGHVNALGEKSPVPVYFGLIPSAAEIWRDRLPAGAPTADEEGIIRDFYAGLGAGVIPIDLTAALAAQSDQALYYRTDHHWTSLGAYYGYTALCSAMGIAPVDLGQYAPTTVTEAFYGTSFSSSGVRWLPPDTIETYVREDGLTVTSYFTGVPEPGALYVPDYLDKKDKYSYFLGGVQPLCVIDTAHADAPKVLVVRDSYSDSLAPFLTENFSQIHLLDLRYYNAPVTAYVQQNDIDVVVVLYSISNFATDNNLFKLGM